MRTELLSAAIRILAEKGVSGLTLDAVAARAGASKGGVLYHFKTKDALFEALIAELLREFDQCIEHFYALEPETPGRFLRAYIRASLRRPGEHEVEALAGLFSVVTVDPSWSRAYWPAMSRWRERALSDGIETGLAMTLLAAADGCYFWEAFRTGVADRHLHQVTLARLLELAGGTADAPPPDALPHHLTDAAWNARKDNP